jgi:hypothetical protein
MKEAHTHMDDTDNVLDGLKLLIECKRYEPGFGFSCKAKDVGLDSFAECLEKDSYRCPFSVAYARTRYCISPARVYIAKGNELSPEQAAGYQVGFAA